MIQVSGFVFKTGFEAKVNKQAKTKMTKLFLQSCVRRGGFEPPTPTLSR